MSDARTVLVTGASRGIGAAIARMVGASGWRVAVNYVSNEEAAKSVVNDIVAKGGEAEAFKADVSDEASIVKLFEAVDERFGRLDALVNNAGVVGMKSRVDAMPLERLQRIMNTNVIGPIVCCREAVRRMSTVHGGAGGIIVNVSSVAAVLGAAGEYVDYAASKGAIDTLTKGLAKEVAAEGIRVNAVRPGVIDTEIHASGGQPDRIPVMRGLVPMKREGKAEEVASAVLWLLSDASSYVTGALIDVTGGR